MSDAGDVHRQTQRPPVAFPGIRVHFSGQHVQYATKMPCLSPRKGCGCRQPDTGVSGEGTAVVCTQVVQPTPSGRLEFSRSTGKTIRLLSEQVRLSHLKKLIVSGCRKVCMSDCNISPVTDDRSQLLYVARLPSIFKPGAHVLRSPDQHRVAVSRCRDAVLLEFDGVDRAVYLNRASAFRQVQGKG